MTALKYNIVDAFASTPFKGNPAAVITFPSADSVPTDTTLQAIATEFNLSETAYAAFRAIEDDGRVAKFTLRWFTPVLEVPLCGHATLATARVLFSSHELSGVEELKFETLFSGILVARKVPGTARIEISLPETPLVPVSADERARFAEVISQAFGGSITVKNIQDAGFYALVHIDPSIDLENAVVNTDAFVSYMIEQATTQHT